MMTPSRIASVIACAVAAWQPSAAFARDNDVQLWVYAVATGHLDDDTSVTVDGSSRWRDRANGDDQQTLRVTFEQDAAEGVRIGGGIGQFETGGATEIRPHQQFTFSRGGFSTRTRIEQRFFDGADRMELRLRQRVGYLQPLGPGWEANIDAEFLTLTQTRNRNSNVARDQWRGRFILQYHASERFTLGAGYLLVFTPQTGRPDQINHVPQVQATRKF